MASIVVYWIHLENHTDMFSQGYIGVSKDTKKRWSEHAKHTGNNHLLHAIKKYGWDNLVKEVILVADKAYCLMIEAKLRAEDKIGWNIVKGGGMPPHINVWNKGRKIPQEELDALKAKGFGFKKGHKTWNTGIKYTEEMKSKIYDIGSYTKGKPAWNKGKPILPHVKEMLRKALTGKMQSEESKLKKSLANKGRVFNRIECPKCKTIGGLTTMKRWHFDKCTGGKKIKARTTINGKRLYLGSFLTQKEVDLAIVNAYKGINYGTN
jgi:predicted GIY-YIG superfamily endonuclease